MTEQGLNKKADEYIQKNMIECIQEQIEYFEFAKQSYIKGAKDNGVIWHDLKKDRNDLPKENKKYLVLTSDGEPKIDSWLNISWVNFYDIIAWKEITLLKGLGL